MRALRFCFVSTFYPPYSAGGDGIAVQRLARELVRQGHSVTVVHDLDAFGTLGRAPFPNEKRSDDGVVVIALHSRLGFASPLLVQQTGRPVLHRRRLAEILNEGSFDVVNFHNASLIGGPGVFRFGGNALRVYTAHEHWLVCPTHILWRDKKEVCTSKTCVKCQLLYHRPPQLWRYTGLMQKSVKYIDAFVAMSDFSRGKHIEFGFEEKMQVIPPCGGNAATSFPTTSPHSRPYFFFAGRLEVGKGLQTLLPVLKRFPEVDLLVAGEGSLKELISSEGGKQVVLLGQLTADSLDGYYHHAIATIVPSLAYETFGLTLIESFRCRSPVIARKIGPFPDIIDASNGGVLFESDDELLAAMQRLAGDAAYRAVLGEQGRSAFVRLWEDSVSANAYLDMVETSIRSKQQTRTA
ncbi:MAG: glycosyltransferase family 4 protein [Gemmatimonadales bacterium]